MKSGHILCIETSTSVCSVALCRDAELIRLKERNEQGIHASALHPMIQDLMKESVLSFSDLSAVAVSSGPGSYTGLRIGVSAAKGICLALNIPLIAVNSLEAMALAMRREYPEYDAYFPMTDARRMEVFTLLLNSAGIIVRPSFTLVANDVRAESWLPGGKVCLAGDGARKINEFYGISSMEVKEDILPSARHLCIPACDQFDRGEFADLVGFEPEYVKEVHTTIPKNMLQP